MSKRIFITGNSSGIGAALTEHYAAAGESVFGMSRRGYRGSAKTRDCQIDLAKLDSLPMALDTLLGDCPDLDLVILNAGILGPVGPLAKTSLAEAKRVMDINLWANKLILDWLLGQQKPVRQIVLISSGASTKGNPGWNVYSISKAALNMLTQLYAHEFPDTHLSAIAPGIVDTAMQTQLCEQTDPSICPSVQYLQSARGTSAMPTPEAAAPLLAQAFEQVTGLPSGDLYDLSQFSKS
ncbi:MAG: SDR family NAD(P)-dependent oxidoreductase [Gammaproteobacteria bacterium]